MRNKHLKQKFHSFNRNLTVLFFSLQFTIVKFCNGNAKKPQQFVSQILNHSLVL